MAELTDLKDVGKSAAESLDESGYSTVQSIATTTPPKLSAATNTGKEKGKKLIRKAQEAAEDLGFQPGSDIMKRRGKVEHIPTGSESLDEMLGAGSRRRASPSSTGSSGRERPSSLTSSLNAQTLEEENGQTPHVVYIDTEHTFRPERVKSMADASGMDPDQALGNIHVARGRFYT